MASTHQVIFRQAMDFAARMHRRGSFGVDDLAVRAADIEVVRHGYRTSRLAKALVRVLRRENLLGYEISDRESTGIVIGARYHDVGKFGIAPEILYKAGKLDPIEYEIVKLHSVMGRMIAGSAVGNRN